MAIPVTTAITSQTLTANTPVQFTVDVPATGGYTTYLASITTNQTGGLQSTPTSTVLTVTVAMNGQQVMQFSAAGGGTISPVFGKSTSAPIAGTTIQVTLEANAAVTVSGAVEAS